jgi:predicted DCC family thiol-disulfide oxidoreductase YuxK
MSLVLFFDGDCQFCSRSVRRIYQFDSGGAFQFATLQGVLAEKIGLRHYSDKDGGSIVILRESDGVTFTKGDAIILLGKTLGGVWAVLAFVFSLLPKSARNFTYDFVARNRYRLAGKGNSCTLSEEGLRERMRE